MKPALLLLLLATAGFAGCAGDPEYKYFAIDVKVDPSVDEGFLRQIEGCGVIVFHLVDGNSESISAANLRCAKPFVKHEVGLAEFSTTLTRGALRFVVELQAMDNQIIAHGASEDFPIVEGADETTTVIARPTGVIPAITPTP